jgi:hypothetical protein
MNKEEFKTKYKYRGWEWPEIGDKVRFLGAEGIFYPHFTNIIEFAKENLKVGQTYTVRNCEVYSSWCAVWLDEIKGDNFFHLSMFEWPTKIENREFISNEISITVEDREKIPAIQPSILMDEETAKKIHWTTYYPF